MSSDIPKLKPSGLWHLLALLVFLAGVGGGIAAVVSGFGAYSDTIDNFARVPSGGAGTVTFAKAGSFTVYFEQPDIDEASPTPNVEVVMTRVSDGTDVPFADYFGNTAYSSSNHDGVAALTFRITEPGAYRVDSAGTDQGGTLAFGRSPFGKIGAGFLQGFLIGTAATIVALVITIVTAVKRGKAKRRRGPILAAAAGYPPQGYPPGYPPQGYPPQGYPQQGYAPQGYPPQGAPPGYPPTGYPPAQGYPPAPGYPPQGYPPAPGPPPSPGQAPPPPAFGPPDSGPPPSPPPGDPSGPGWGAPGT